MVDKITSFKSSTGKIFDTEFEAHCEELRDFLMRNGADNDAIARKIVKAIADGQPETLSQMRQIVDSMSDCAPLPAPSACTLCNGCGKHYPTGEVCGTYDCPGF